MRVSSRSKASFLFSFIALVALTGTFVFRSAAHSADAAGVSSSSKGTMGSTKVVATVDPMKFSTGKAPSIARNKMMPVRTRPKTSGANVVGRPGVAGVPFAASRLLRNFDGVNAIEDLNANGYPSEPADEGLGVGNGYVFNIVNSTGAIYRTNGTVVVQPFDYNIFYAEPLSAFLSDPRTYYDKATNTWFSTILEADIANASESHIDLAVNASGNPTRPWTIYRIDTTNAGAKGVSDANCPCFADYPIFGIDQYNVYISGQEYPIAGNGNTNGSEIYVLSKSQLEVGAAASYARFGSLNVAGTIAFHVQPATSYNNPPAEYFMNSLDPNSTFDNRIGVWAMTNRQAVAKGGMPNLSVTVITSEAYGFPVDAQTPVGFNSSKGKPTSGLIQSDFDAMQEVEYINGHLYGALCTLITIPGDTGSRDGLAWFEVKPNLSGSVIGGSTRVTDQGYVASQGNFLLYPHIERSADGTTAMVFSITGPNVYPSAAYAVKPARQHKFGAIQIACAGAAPDNGTSAVGGSGRWGDYSAGQLDPTSNNIWFATQYIPNNGTRYANWGNRVFEVAA